MPGLFLTSHDIEAPGTAHQRDLHPPPLPGYCRAHVNCKHHPPLNNDGLNEALNEMRAMLHSGPMTDQK